jgi:hypothetical protein
MPPQEDEAGALEQARKRLYDIGPAPKEERHALSGAPKDALPHGWQDVPQVPEAPITQKKRFNVAGLFFGLATLFFVLSAGIAGYFFYFGGNTVSPNKIAVEIQGPTSIAGGETIPLSIKVVNRNPVALENASIEIEFPPNARSASNTTETLPRYTEKLGSIESGATITRSIKAVLFGGKGDSIILPVTISYSTPNSKSVFVKKTSYPIEITATPLDLQVDALTESVSGKTVVFTVAVRSNAPASIQNVVVKADTPYGFALTSSSVPQSNSSFLLGTLAPGSSKTVSIVGTLSGQEGENKVFNFSVGTANGPMDGALAVTYMSHSNTIALRAPFIATTFTLNNDSSENLVASAGGRQNVSISYKNTLPTSVSNVRVEVAISGSAVDYDSITATRGFYRSVDHTVVFAPDTDSALANLAPNASGIGAFNFAALPASKIAGTPTMTFVITVSGTRMSETNVPESVSASLTRTAKVTSGVLVTASSAYSSGPFQNTGPIPPKANEATTYSILWAVNNQGSAIADASMTATLPNYVSYAGKTSGQGTVTYDVASRTITWKIGNLAQQERMNGAFQVSIVPSISQRGSAPNLTSAPSFSGHDRFAGVSVTATGEAATTETKGDPGYVSAKSNVQ